MREKTGGIEPYVKHWRYTGYWCSTIAPGSAADGLSEKGLGVMPTFFVPDLFLDGISYQSSDYWRQRPSWTVALNQRMR
jgi:hypothetical protein